MLRLLKLFLIFIPVFSQSEAFSKSVGSDLLNNPESEQKLIDDARNKFSKGFYQEAKSIYSELVKNNPNSIDYQFETGLAYFYSEVEKEKALDFFEKALALDKENKIGEIIYYCGLTSLYCDKPQKAKDYFGLFNGMIDAKINPSLASDVHRLMEMCDNALASENPKEKINILNAGKNINSIYNEYAPVVYSNGSKLIFTSRKRGTTGGKKAVDTKYFEDIYISVFENGEWQSALKIDSTSDFTNSKINTGRHNAGVSVNSTENTLYVYKDADLYQSSLKDNKWSEPVKLNKNINSKLHEPSVFVSSDEKFLLFVSNRKDGIGGRDIYISEKKDNQWQESKNLGTIINTPYDDDAPFISKDGNTLFFSSKGHNSIGGFDIFKSEKDANGNWSKPVNLGRSINSTADDIYYISYDSLVMFSSNRVGTTGAMDIYFIQPEKTEKPKDSTIAEIPKDSIESIKSDSKLPFHESAINSVFDQNFNYNIYQINDSDVEFRGLLNHISSIINQESIVEIIIQSSASKVPTTTFKTNKKLAEKRAEEAEEKIRKALIGAGFKENQFTFSKESKVDGPNYKNDFETNRSTYEQYQFIKVTTR